MEKLPKEPFKKQKVHFFQRTHKTKEGYLGKVRKITIKDMCIGKVTKTNRSMVNVEILDDVTKSHAASVDVVFHKKEFSFHTALKLPPFFAHEILDRAQKCLRISGNFGPLEECVLWSSKENHECL